jgi:PadR family transcriptional regulator PadR
MPKKLKPPVVPDDLLGQIEQLVLIAVLRLGDEAYGMSVFEALRTTAYASISFGSVYTALERLTWKGYLQSQLGEPIASRGGRAKKYFHVTGAGKRALNTTEEAVRRARLISLPATSL